MQDTRDRLGSKEQSVKVAVSKRVSRSVRESVREPEKESVPSSKRKTQADSGHQRREMD
jgi:hypothetical protein